MFRACFARFRRIVEHERNLTRVCVSLEANATNERKNVWGRKDEEYVADFCLVSRRHLDDDEYRLFKYYFLLGADWKLCCRKLGMDRGLFFHAVYRIQQRLGKAFHDLEPYALYPVEQYFTGGRRRPPAFAEIEENVTPIRPPLASRANKPRIGKIA